MKTLTIELELLTPLKYKESIHVSNTGWGVVLEIKEIYKKNDVFKNTYAPHNIGRQATDEDISEAEECLLIESSELSEKKYKESVEFKGLHKLEGQHRPVCNFVYIVKNVSEKVRNALTEGHRRQMKYYVKRSDIDQETVNVFGDIYNSL